MATFIKVRRIESGHEYETYVNADLIRRVTPYSGESANGRIFFDKDDAIFVKETPKEVAILVSDALV